MNLAKNGLIIATSLCVLIILLIIANRYLPHKNNGPVNAEPSLIETISSYIPFGKKQARFKTQKFDFSTVKGISENQLQQHEKLYQGYVQKRNEIDQTLRKIGKGPAGITYSPYRSLKIAETFARNGALLHELYFENLGTSGEPGPRTLALIKKDWGSLEAYKKDLFAAAGCARGWAITTYNLDDGHLATYVLDAHNETVPILTIPLLVIDTYEHAYMIDFGINRAEYLNTVWNAINWDVVEERINKWIPA